MVSSSFYSLRALSTRCSDSQIRHSRKARNMVDAAKDPMMAT